MKAVLVIDIPNELDVNDLLIDYCVHTKGEYKQIRKGGNYSLKPMPEKLKLRIQREWITDYDRYEIGYNACIEEIMGETE